MKLQNTKGFTLIELLVVITIIGILATGATSVYTSQIQKARDTTRINDIKAVQGACEQFYWDVSVYPDTVSSGTLNQYLGKIPKDPKSWASSASGSYLDYAYASGALDLVEGQRFELSTGFENKSNVSSKAANTKDNGNEDSRFEIGVPDNTDGKLNLTTSSGAYIWG